MPKPSATSSSFDGLVSICHQYGASLVAVSKTRTEKEILELYKQGQRVFGENRAHELIIKASLLPSDIEWHVIGHLQTNKVKSVIRYAVCIQSLDSLKLWQKIQDEAKEAELNLKCLLQIKIATEESKHGWNFEDLEAILRSGQCGKCPNVEISGVMGMASLTNDGEQVRREFKQLKNYFDLLKQNYFTENSNFTTISMGMSSDYMIALEEGSNMIRIGSLLFDQ